MEGKSNVSYTPFVLLDDGYYILISIIARHARKRLTYEAQAVIIERDTTQWKTAIETMQERFGEIIDNLSNMANFTMFQLPPKNGLFVKGFGKAFQVGAGDLIDTVQLDQGHQTIDSNKPS